MSFLGVVEIIDRSGVVRSRTRIDHLPFKLGRALDNDLIIDDLYVDPQHAELRDEDGLKLFDLKSVNGTFQGLQRTRSGQLDFGGSVDFRLGHTLLRFRPVNEELATTELDPLATSRLFALDRPHWALPALGGGIAALVLERALASPQVLQLGTLASSVMPAILLVLVWALAWSMANRMVSHRFHYLGHLSIASFGVLSASALDPITSYLGFAFAADDTMGSFGMLLGAVLLAAVIYVHLRLISRGSGSRLLVPAAAVAFSFLAISILPGASDSGFSSEPKFSGSLKLPAAALRAGLTGDAFYAEAEHALDEADAEAKEE